ncbi:TerB family tellurite resistance protein [Methylobacterium aerolatum]|uniref:Tellurite resistance protein B-like protein n=1 Tax=Methylobacterium aerolatum TaxID=418708 RepID=A0ABU0I0V9_9HYPH|nr:TerB family tellurite resistance protein [Methylobacterium aerolatum]MDQ0447673.1 putative tellurite resistance protein B-like protein [Methylobacterium aerolatum]GJD34773.1 hypothetical protein FMGBMHLM_1676 [Methylobacterium aerolatum]
MSLIARVRAYAVDVLGIGSADQRKAVDDTHLAATALLVHVARVDGILAFAESERLARLVEGHYAEGPAAARDLITRAAAVDIETRDVASLVEMLPHEADSAERSELLAMAWSVAAADGVVDEFEEALVERLGRLLGFDEPTIAAARRTGTADAPAP